MEERKVNLIEEMMVMPRFHGLVKVVFHIVAVLGCLGGLLVIIEGFNRFGAKMLTYSWAMEKVLIAGISGLLVIILSLTVLGLVYGYLAMVKAQIDSRNAIVSYTQLKTEHYLKAASRDHEIANPENVQNHLYD